MKQGEEELCDVRMTWRDRKRRKSRIKDLNLRNEGIEFLENGEWVGTEREGHVTIFDFFL